jgi:outer membrane immunogenic protein
VGEYVFPAVVRRSSIIFCRRSPQSEFGWVAGAGIEYKLLDHWLLRAEYLHYDFGKVQNLVNSINLTTAIDTFTARTTVDAVRGGVSYKF